MRHRATGLLPACLLASCALAAEPGLTEKDFLGEVPIVLSVSRLPQPLNEAPGAVSVIDRETIRRSGAREVAEVLRLVPGFQTVEARGGNPVAVYHGAFFENANRIQVLVDGRSVYSPFYTGTASIGMRTVSLEDIERIEVLRGSNSATYGARAVLGVINIVTRDPADTPGAMARLRAGGRHLRDATARIGWGGEAGSYRLSADRRGDAGLGDADANRLGNVNFRADLRTSARDTLELRAGASDQRWSDGFAGMPDNPPRTRRYDGAYVQGDWRRSLAIGEELRISYSHNEESYRDRYDVLLGALPPVDADFGGRGRVDALELAHRFAASAQVRIAWGGEWRSERLRSEPLYGRSDWLETRFLRLNGNVEWRIVPALILNAGAMLEDHSASGGEVLPRAMLNWLAAPGHTLRAGVSRAARPPSTFERLADQRLVVPGVGFLQNWRASPGLRAEKLDAAELGYYGDWRPAGVTLDVRAFQERIRDFIEIILVPAPAGALNPAGPTFVNGRALRMRGLEYQATWRPVEATRLIASQSFVKPDFPIDGAYLSVPRATTSLALFQRLGPDWDLAVIHARSGAMTWLGPGSMVAPRERTDLRLARALRIGGTRAEAALVVQSAGGAHEEYLPGLAFERRVFATLRVGTD